MHLQVGNDLHGIVRGNQIVLVPCNCPYKHVPSMLPEIKLPEFAASFFPMELFPKEET